MMGIVVVTHGHIGTELVKAVQHVLPESTQIRAIAVEANEAPQQVQQRVASAMQEVHSPSGILLLTDMFGGTPSNICMSFLQAGSVEVISGVNLPMLLKLAHLQKEQNLTELAHFIQEYGKKNIVIASEVLERKKA